MITLQERVHGTPPPADWQANKLRNVLRVRRGMKNTGMQEDNLLSLSYGRIIRKDIDANEGLLPESFETYQIVEPGNIVMRLTDLQNDKRSIRQGLVTERGIITSAYDALEIAKGHDPRFWAYTLLALDLAKYYYSLGAGVRQSIKFADFPNDWIRTPCLETQKSIADFLDRETARIDQLIEKKQRLVELLIEREKNLIGECLARGIDTDVEFKITPHEWLGRIPSHWEVFPLKSLIWYQEGPGIMAEDFREEGVPLLRIKGLSGQYATLQGCNYLDRDQVQRRWNHFRVELGDFLISASATRGGIASLVTEEVVGAVPYTGIIRIKPRAKGYLSEIIPYFLLSSLFDTQIDLLSAGSTIQHFGPTHLGRMKAPVPPKEEQRKIAAFLDKRVPLIRQARAQTEESQVKLKEFRSALIASAVTGQIDVATWGKQGQTDRRLDEIEEAMQA